MLRIWSWEHTWRCKLFSSTLSWSMIPRHPTYRDIENFIRWAHTCRYFEGKHQFLSFKFCCKIFYYLSCYVEISIVNTLKKCCLKCYLSFRRHQYILLSFYAQWFEDCLIHGVWLESKYSTKRKHILLPMPAAAKYSATGEPRPPAPTTKIDDLRRFCCPAQMIIQSISWTLHLI